MSKNSTKEQKKRWNAKYYLGKGKETMDRYGETEKGKAVRKLAQQNRRARDPEKVKARAAVAHMVRTGQLVRPNVCEHCDDHVFTEASHTDYDRPLDVEWLCRPCHRIKDA